LVLGACGAGCALVTGLSDLQEVESIGDGGGMDATAGDAPGHDAPAPPRDGSPDSFVADSGVDAPLPPPVDAGEDAPFDAGVDAPIDAGIDAPPIDCGPVDTIQNCTACGLACDTAVSLDAGCNGATCTYGGCLAGHSDCVTTAPNTNGCECQTPFCCANACADVHANGLGGHWFDCTSVGTYTQTQADQACISFTLSDAGCSLFPCGGSGGQAVCATATKNACYCWAFSGPGGGHVSPGTPGVDGGLATCMCPSASDVKWQ
jgi:hypothetical protein